MNYNRNPETAYPEEEEDPRPRDRWGRFLPFDIEGADEERIDNDDEYDDEEEPIDDDEYEDDE